MMTGNSVLDSILGCSIIMNLLLMVFALLLDSAHSQLKHMAAHGHDLKHKHSDREAAPAAPAAGGEDSRPVEFDEAFVEISKYFKENKHSKVPQAVSVTLSDGTVFRLGKWYVDYDSILCLRALKGIHLLLRSPFLERVQRQRQLYKNTYTTPGAREGFGQMTDGQRDKLATVQFLFDPTVDLCYES